MQLLWGHPSTFCDVRLFVIFCFAIRQLQKNALSFEAHLSEENQNFRKTSWMKLTKKVLNFKVFEYIFFPFRDCVEHWTLNSLTLTFFRHAILNITPKTHFCLNFNSSQENSRQENSRPNDFGWTRYNHNNEMSSKVLTWWIRIASTAVSRITSR